MDELVKEFVEEASEMLSEIDADLIRLETDPSDKELLDKIFRLMHTIKGTCGFISLSRLERTAHVAENLLDHFRSGNIAVDETLITLLLMSIDRVRYLLSEVGSKGFEPDGDDRDLNDVITQAIADAVLDKPAEAAPKKAKAKKTKSKASATTTEDKTTPQPEPGEATAEEAEAAPVNVPEPDVPAVAEDPASAPRPDAAPEYLKVPMNVLESMIDMVSELVLSRNQLLQKARMEENSSFHASFQRLNRIVSDLQDVVMKTRMQPIGNAWLKLPRIVRDLSRELGKKIQLVTEGEETELDRQVLELIKDPLTHMIRNSCDHGIETPSARQAAGKREQGTIKLRAFHEGGLIVIQIRDDGKGIDPAIIGAKAVEKGLVSAEKLKTLSDKQILSYIMRPGFSTAEQITSVSGRGVGMDVVRANIEQIGGSIDIDSLPGKGTTLTIQIPLTLAIISALIVELEGCRYAIPQVNIQELVSLGGENAMEYISNKPVLRLRDKVIPVIDSGTLFHQSQSAATEHQDKFIVVMSTGACTYGVIVDRIFDTEEVVIKSISSVLRNTHIYAGNTILGDGQVIMILDPGAIARQFNVEKDMAQAADAAEETKAETRIEETITMLVFRAGGGAMKALPLQLVSRLQVFPTADIVKSGEKLVINFDGQIIHLGFADPQQQQLEGEYVTTIILSDDRSGSVMGVIIDELVDIAGCAADITLSTVRPGTLGSTRYGEQIVDVLDISHFLQDGGDDWFSSQSHALIPYQHDEDFTLPHPDNDDGGEAPAPRRQKGLRSFKPSLLLVDDSNFFRSMLKPILMAAGYSVTVSEDPLQAIALHDEGHMFDIVLSDIEMPHMDGYAFVEKMRADSKWKETPFIAITSHNTVEDAQRGYEKGFDEYVGKFEKSELLAMLASVHQSRQMRSAAHV